MRLSPVLILFLLLAGCSTTPELTGHWHLSLSNEGYSYVTNLDFISDSSFLYNEQLPRWEGMPGHLDQEEKTLYWGGECLLGDWRYQALSKNTLELYDRQSNELIGSLIRTPDCSPPDDLFLESKLDIELPLYKNSPVEIGPLSLVREIMIGSLKDEFKPSYSAKTQITLGNKIVNPVNSAQFSLFDLQHEVKIPEAKRGQLKVLIYLDNHTPIKALKPVLDHYAGKRKELYFAGITSKSPDAQIAYQIFNVCDLLEKLKEDYR